MSRNEGEQEPVVVRDRRRIDPVTGQRRVPAPSGEEAQVAESMSGTLDEDIVGNAEQEAAQPAAEQPEPEEAAGDSAGLQQQVDELTADLKRVTAEYANYRKRVERDREAVIAGAKASVAADLLTVLDDLDRAEAHGDLNGAFKAVADKLVATLNSAGLEPFGAEGDEFDPSVHEAVQHGTSPDVQGPTVTTVLRRGYRFGDRVLRPAMVVVTDHEPAAEPAEPATGENQSEQG
ncbi:nucleotide exchange factor GrpE [Saccharopolyspora sp. ASAGF58]|uniref:nucleotide exchange factor GrpE n=1 Tax=Saccharopolyspora sp. ASAGF58 TaxID=2719023 RepID=UPI00143FCA9E|nr:nucleotide exchange factor GrpE [Saccharopolyspora sp. ASAGF58]QIZ39416.1 nucleotide exchange factor GrpE [Saccharopolyspora sp. ASAGF58]